MIDYIKIVEKHKKDWLMSPAGCRGQCVDDGKTLAMLSWGGVGRGGGGLSSPQRWGTLPASPSPWPPAPAPPAPRTHTRSELKQKIFLVSIKYFFVKYTLKGHLCLWEEMFFRRYLGNKYSRLYLDKEESVFSSVWGKSICADVCDDKHLSS